jgi:hypothetical protein
MRNTDTDNLIMYFELQKGISNKKYLNGEETEQHNGGWKGNEQD